jgi:hypothetical protein
MGIHIFIDIPAIARKAFPWLSPALLCGGPSAGRTAVAAAMEFSLNIQARFYGWRASGRSAKGKP